MVKKSIKNRNTSKLNISLENPEEIERFVLIIIVGLLNSLQHNVISIEDTECRFFSPYTYNMLKKMNVKKDIVELVMDGCLLEDFDSIISDKLDNEIIRIKEKALSLLNKHKNVRSNVDTYHWIDNNK